MWLNSICIHNYKLRKYATYCCSQNGAQTNHTEISARNGLSPCKRYLLTFLCKGIVILSYFLWVCSQIGFDWRRYDVHTKFFFLWGMIISIIKAAIPYHLSDIRNRVPFLSMGFTHMINDKIGPNWITKLPFSGTILSNIREFFFKWSNDGYAIKAVMADGVPTK